MYGPVIAPAELTSGIHSPLHSADVTHNHALAVGFAAHTPRPLKTPLLTTGSQHGVLPEQPADFWQMTPQL